MSNPESRRIFYFLVLNLFYMMVQMLYGVWTNSLGLISDGMCSKSRYHPRLRIVTYKYTAIHMGFDCMAIGVGLFASIMATWPPNERFTYGLVAWLYVFYCTDPMRRSSILLDMAESRHFPVLRTAFS